MRSVPEFNKIRDVVSTRSHFVAAHSRVESLRKLRQHPPFQPSFQLPLLLHPLRSPFSPLSIFCARKSVRTICHALHPREKSRDYRILIVTPLSSPCIICHNSAEVIPSRKSAVRKTIPESFLIYGGKGAIVVVSFILMVHSSADYERAVRCCAEISSRPFPSYPQISLWTLLTRVIAAIAVLQREIMHREFSMRNMERKHAFPNLPES